MSASSSSGHFLDDIPGWHIFKLVQPLLAEPRLAWSAEDEVLADEPQIKAKARFSENVKAMPEFYTDRCLSGSEFETCKDAATKLMGLLEGQVKEKAGASGADAPAWDSAFMNAGNWLAEFAARATNKTIDLAARATGGAVAVFTMPSGLGHGSSPADLGALQYPKLEALGGLVQQRELSGMTGYMCLPHSLAPEAAATALLLLSLLKEIAKDKTMTVTPAIDWADTNTDKPRVASSNLVSLLKRATLACKPSHRAQLYLDSVTQMQPLTLELFLSSCTKRPASSVACWRRFRYTSVQE